MEKVATKEINVGQVRITDGFWSKIQDRIIDTVIPFQEKVLRDEMPGVEKSHAIENFRIAAGLSSGEYYGMVFQDSDLAKWLEGVAYSLSLRPDKALEERADEIIAIIEKAQQPDGYLNTYFTLKEPGRRWQNLHECHELYCAGHMMEAAVAYWQCTGKDKLLHVMERMADYIISRFGEGKQRGIPGHQEVEIGLMKLYRATGKEKYKEMARFFLEERGKDPEFFYKEKVKRGWQHWGQYTLDPLDNQYEQSHAVIYEQKEAVGHAVRAVYMYTAMADLAGMDGDERLFEACETLWDNIVQKRMYITGGIGSTVKGEAFTLDYDLPNDTAYAETCASIAMVFFAGRMLKAEPDGKYADIMERELFNGVLCGIQLDGKRYFYVNPLEVNPGISGKLFGYEHVLPTRPGWYSCACCPPNLVRLLTSLGSYVWSEREGAVYSHLFLSQRADLEKAVITVKSGYPWEGKVSYEIEPKTSEPFLLGIHIPGYVDLEGGSLRVTVDGEEIAAGSCLKKGYLCLERAWKDKDKVDICFGLKARKIYANPKVRADEGCVAFMRGPVVYCFEGVDNGPCLQALRIPRKCEPKERLCEEGLLEGNILLSMDGCRMEMGEGLYSETRPQAVPVRLTAIPYYAWANRGESQMRVWMVES